MSTEINLPNPITPENIEYLKDQIGGLFGKDRFSRDFAKKLAMQTALSSEEAQSIHCVGMAEPIPITSGIYQETRLKAPQASKINRRNSTSSFWDVLAEKKNAIILAEAGQGKTTLLRYIYTTLLKELGTRKEFPVLYTLRHTNAVINLSEFVESVAESSELAGRALKKQKSNRFVLLVDGYDEIEPEKRGVVSSILRKFASLHLGNFFLTCRTYYIVEDLSGSYYQIDDFSRDDAFRFIGSFSKAYGTNLNPNELLRELEDRRLESFYAHPLLLALVCILKSNLPGGKLSPGDSRALPSLPERPIDLIDSAITTLTLRWDDYKGVKRPPRINIYGPDRVKLLEMIAYKMHPSLFIQRGTQRGQLDYLITEWLKARHKASVDVSTLLEEIAQWYGIFVPTPRGTSWIFAHRTMQDFLGARYWLSSTGRFDPRNVSFWDHRAAYAASMLDDATDCLVYALQKEANVIAFTECLHNNVPFSSSYRVAEAVVNHFDSHGTFNVKKSTRGLEAVTDQDFFHLVSYELLNSMLSVAMIGAGESRKPARDLVLAYTLDEFRSRPEHRLTHQDVNKLRISLSLMPNNFEFRVIRSKGWSKFLLSDVMKRMPDF